MSQDTIAPLILATSDTCHALGGISRGKLWQLANAGEIDRVKIGSRVFFTAKSIAAYVDRLAEAATSAA
jgi:hypothetical protein